MGDSKFIFLDNWVLSGFTNEPRRTKLTEFLRREDLTVLITSLSMTEIYGPTASPGDRVSRATDFLAGNRCVIVDPVQIFRAEFQHFPASLPDLPFELDLAEVSIAHRAMVLELFLRRDPIFLRQGKDIAEWAANYTLQKTTWLNTTDQIIQAAIQDKTLARDSNGEFLDLESFKDEFLASLDRRHFVHLSSLEREALDPNSLIGLVLGETRQLPATRITSLCFWHAYVATDRANTLKRNGSDLGDFLQMSLIPYCSYFTLDGTMFRLMQRVQADLPVACKLLRGKELLEEIGLAD